MELYTTRNRIESVIERWKQQYNPGNNNVRNHDIQLKFERLESLDLKTATAEQVNAIIGNSSWTDITCDECGEDVEMAVVLGDELDYNSNTTIICVTCLKEALSLCGL